jgi:hypothetical protein
MTTQPLTITVEKCSTGFAGPDFAQIFTWAPLGNGDDGTVIPTDYLPWLDRTFQVEGTFGAGGTLVIEGSNDGINFHTLTDPQGLALSFTGPGLRQVVEVTLQVRPRVTGGDGTTALTVTGLARRTALDV